MDLDGAVARPEPAPGHSGDGSEAVGEGTGPLTFANSVIPGASDNSAGASGADAESTRVSAYARLDFESFTFYVQTLQVVLGRRGDSGNNVVDVHLGASKAISRQHAKIFYNFATQRFELTVMGRNGAFVKEKFVSQNHTVPLANNTTVQIGEISFNFILPEAPPRDDSDTDSNDMDQTVDQTLELRRGSVGGESSDETNFFAAVQKKQQKQQSHQPKPVKEKKVYKPEEIPVEYREKPPGSYSNLITRALQERAPDGGLSLADIYEAIMEIYPYYRYCPPGWQNSVRHNLSSSKAFRKVAKEGKGWLWGLDQTYFQEKETKRQAAKRRTSQSASDNKSIAELAQEISPRQQPAHTQPAVPPQAAKAPPLPGAPSQPGIRRSSSNDLLSPATVRLLAKLQQQLQGHIAKAGGKPLNPTLLTNALAVVVARAVKQAGGVDALEGLLQSQQQVNTILVQALELVRQQTQRRVSNPSGPRPEIKQEIKQEQQPQGAPPGDRRAQSFSQYAQLQAQLKENSAADAQPHQNSQSTAPSKEATESPAPTPSHYISPQLQPQSTTPAIPATQSVSPPPEAPQPSASPPVSQAKSSANKTVVPTPVVPAKTTPEHQDFIAAQIAQKTPAKAPVSDAQAPAKPRYTPEQIANIIAQAEKVQSPTPQMLAAIERLRAHQQSMLKRPPPSDDTTHAAKRPATIHEV